MNNIIYGYNNNRYSEPKLTNECLTEITRVLWDISSEWKEEANNRYKGIIKQYLVFSFMKRIKGKCYCWYDMINDMIWYDVMKKIES